MSLIRNELNKLFSEISMNLSECTSINIVGPELNSGKPIHGHICIISPNSSGSCTTTGYTPFSNINGTNYCGKKCTSSIPCDNNKTCLKLQPKYGVCVTEYTPKQKKHWWNI